MRLNQRGDCESFIVKSFFPQHSELNFSYLFRTAQILDIVDQQMFNNLLLIGYVKINDIC